MYIYNVSVRVETDIVDEWVGWMKNHHIPAVIETGCFVTHQMHRLIQPEMEDGVTFVMQYQMDSLEDYERYQSIFAPTLQQETKDRYGDKVLAFRTLMQTV